MIKTQFVIFLVFFFASNPIAKAANFDAEILRTIHTNRNVSLDKLMQGISDSPYIIMPAISIGLFTSGVLNDDKNLIGQSIQIGVSNAISALSAYSIKQIVKRERPFVTYNFIENVGKESGFSMPSGHTSVAFATATSLSLQYPKWYIIVPSYLWASSVAYSRMHLGVHYLTDVLVGIIIGSGISYITFQLEKEVMKKYK